MVVRVNDSSSPLVQYSTLTVQYSTVQYSNSTVQYSTVQYSILQCNTRKIKLNLGELQFQFNFVIYKDSIAKSVHACYIFVHRGTSPLSSYRVSTRPTWFF